MTIKFLFLSILLFTSVLRAEEIPFSTHIKSTATDGFDKTGYWILATGAAATLLALNYDQRVHDSWKDHQQMPAETSRYGDFWGSGIPEVLIFSGQTYFDKENGIPAFEGFLLGGLVTHTAKFVISRERPDSQTKTSMPSGHTQAAFSLAASMTESYGWKVGLPFWCMGLFTGLTRLADNAHWLSDVAAGATIGAFFGRAGYSHHQHIQPTVLFEQGHVDGAGVAITKEW